MLRLVAVCVIHLGFQAAYLVADDLCSKKNDQCLVKNLTF